MKPPICFECHQPIPDGPGQMETEDDGVNITCWHADCYPGQKRAPTRSRNLDDYGEVLTVQEACVVLRVGQAYLYQQLRAGAIPAIRLANKWRITKATLRELLERRISD